MITNVTAIPCVYLYVVMFILITVQERDASLGYLVTNFNAPAAPASLDAVQLIQTLLYLVVASSEISATICFIH